MVKAELMHTFEADERAVTAVRFVDGGRAILTGGGSGHLRRWDTTHWIGLSTVDAHDKAIRSIAVAGESIITTGADRVVRTWRSHDGRALYALQRRVIAEVDPQQRYLAAITSRGRVCLHALDTGAEQSRMRTLDHRPMALAWTPGGSALLVGGEGSIHRLHPFSGERVGLHEGPPGVVMHLDFGGDDAGFAAICDTGALSLWSTTGQLRHQIDTEGAAPGGLCYSPDGGLIAISLAYQVQIRETDSGRLLTRIKSVIKGMFGVDWSADGQRLACGSADGRVRVWHIER